MTLLHPVHTLIKELYSEGLQCHPNTSGRRVEYQSDILGWVTEVPAEVAGQMQSILSQIEYRVDGQITAAMFGNGLSETRTYDQQGRLVHQDLKDETGLIVDERVYEYDPAGNINARTGSPGDQHYSYDALDRLTGQDITDDSKNWQYDYGPNHNRQSRTDGDLLEELYSYQPDTNRLTEVDNSLASQTNPYFTASSSSTTRPTALSNSSKTARPWQATLTTPSASGPGKSWRPKARCSITALVIRSSLRSMENVMNQRFRFV